MKIFDEFWQNIRNAWGIYYPEIISFLLIPAVPSFIILSSIEVNSSSLESISSLLVQVLAAYLGLLLATFGVLYGLNLKNEYIKKATESNLGAEKINEIKKSLESIYKGFVISIALLAVGTFMTFIIYVLTILSKSNAIFAIENPSIANSVVLGFLMAFFVNGTINIISTVKTILALTE